jgi:hypothetical protein
VRIFPTGAIRDANGDKYEYARFLDPRVLRAYAAFMHRHRSLPDGTKREPDNWKKGMGESYLDSLLRHVMDLWELDHYGECFRPESGEAVELVDALCAVIFNAHGWLYEHLKASAKRRVDLSAGAEDGPQLATSRLSVAGTPGLRLSLDSTD